VAIYHFSVKVIGRSGGRSAIASAAYRAGERLHDEKLDRHHDYTQKAGIVHREILLPDGAPARWLDRGTLWNEVEAGEKRKDAQLARDIEISLPRELGQAEAIRLAQDFVREQFVARGMVADLNVHWTKAADGELQPHAHVMLTLRAVVSEQSLGQSWNEGQDGGTDRAEPAQSLSSQTNVSGMAVHRFGEVGQVGQVSPSGTFGKKVVAWNDRALLKQWRERWASMANERLTELGHDVRIDHRSYAEQGLSLEPQNKIGPAGARREQRGEEAERAAEHVEIARRNGEQIIDDPTVVLDAITRQHSTFTRRDLARFVDRHTANREQFDLAMAKAEASPELVPLGPDGRGQERFTTRDMLETEQRMEAAAAVIGGRDRHRVSLMAGNRALKAAEQRGLVLGEEQRAAYQHVTSGPDLALVVGYAGTGKSAMLGVAKAAWEAKGLTVRGATLSGIAAEGLEAGSGIPSRTLASLEWNWKEGRDPLTSRDVLVVDEAGLVGSRQLERVLTAAQSAGAKVVLVGDPEQLQAIEAGAAFRALAERHGAREISEVRRQRIEWQRAATRELATERTGPALERYAAAGMVHAAESRGAAKAALVAGWDAVRQQSPTTSQVILAYTRDDVRDLNGLARERLRAGGVLGPDQVVQTERGERHFAAGDRLMFLRNERGLGAQPGDGDGRERGGVAVKNGTLGQVLAVEAGGERLTVRLDGPGGGPGGEPGRQKGQEGRNASGRVVTFYLRDYGHIDHGYATTIHKAQGVTVDRAHVLASGHMDRHAAYVALTRHRDGVALHYGQDEFANAGRLARTLGRERLKDTSLDYGRLERDQGQNQSQSQRRPERDGGSDLAQRYAERRGLDRLRPESEIVVSRSSDLAPFGPALGSSSQAEEQTQERRVDPAKTSPGNSKPAPDLDAVRRQEIAAGRAGFRERYEARQRQKALEQAAARDNRAQGWVDTWDQLMRNYRTALPNLNADPNLGGSRDQLLWFGRALQEQPEIVQVLRERGSAFGLQERPNLARVVAGRQPERVVEGILDAAETGMRTHLQKVAQQEAARQRELEAKLRPSRGFGPSR
jgi:Ti-type conjugative transfer relaxase TraA